MSIPTDRDAPADLVDEIDALITGQLDGGEPRTGFDYGDPTFPKCPHSWCDEHWHGLAITQNMRRMRSFGMVDPAYRYADDDSPVLCPGSEFRGEFVPPSQELSPLDKLYGCVPVPTDAADITLEQWQEMARIWRDDVAPMVNMAFGVLSGAFADAAEAIQAMRVAIPAIEQDATGPTDAPA